MPVVKARAAIAVVVGAAVLGQLHALGDLAPVVVGLLLAGVIVALLGWRDRRAGQTLMDPSAFIGPLAVCWLVTALLPVHSFSQRSSAEAATAVGLQPVLELVVFLMVGLVAAAAIRVLEPTLERSRPPAVLFLLPIWIIASTVWSASAPYAFVRGWQMAIVVVLTWATVALGRRDPTLVHRLVEVVLRWAVRAVAVLVVLGVAFGGIYTTVTASNAGRFTWIGAHPNGSGLAISAGIVITLVAPRRVLQMPAAVHAAVAGGLLWAMYANHSRASWLAVLAAVLTAFALKSRLSPLVRFAGTPLLGAAAVAAIHLRGDAIWDYVLRDRSSSELATGNGRRALWGIGARALDTTFDWICGLGYGITRTVFLEEAPWAGEAHNSILALLVGVGLVGVVLFTAALGQTIWNVVASGLWVTTDLGLAVIALLVLVLVNGLSTDVLAEPTIGWALLNLIAALAIVQRSVATGADRRRAESARGTLALDLTGGTSHGR